MSLNNSLDTISPKDMKIAVEKLSKINSRVHYKVFKNDMIMLHSGKY